MAQRISPKLLRGFLYLVAIMDTAGWWLGGCSDFFQALQARGVPDQGRVHPARVTGILAMQDLEVATFTRLTERQRSCRSPLEGLDGMVCTEEYDLVINSAPWGAISMHECRDIEKVTANMHYRALKPDG